MCLKTVKIVSQNEESLRHGSSPGHPEEVKEGHSGCASWMHLETEEGTRTRCENLDPGWTLVNGEVSPLAHPLRQMDCTLRHRP